MSLGHENVPVFFNWPNQPAAPVLFATWLAWSYQEISSKQRGNPQKPSCLDYSKMAD